MSDSDRELGQIQSNEIKYKDMTEEKRELAKNANMCNLVANFLNAGRQEKEGSL